MPTLLYNWALEENLESKDHSKSEYHGHYLHGNTFLVEEPLFQHESHAIHERNDLALDKKARSVGDNNWLSLAWS